MTDNKDTPSAVPHVVSPHAFAPTAGDGCAVCGRGPNYTAHHPAPVQHVTGEDRVEKVAAASYGRYRPPGKSKDRLDHLDELDKQENKLRLEKLAAEAQAYHAEAYRQMPADMRQRAEEWGVSALMEAVWLNGWDCGYRQSNRDRAVLASTEGAEG